ncbi:MAG TPA: hypothetical protein PL193_03940 [Xanthobacteraceae bacterium]|nr:hypothetical protein [Xanthobacteraceae bacterium]
MPRFKFVLLDHRYHVRAVEETDFETDEMACERARSMYGNRAPYAVEVWDGGRFVCRVNEAGLHFSPPPPIS